MREITDGRGVSEPGAFFARTLAVTVGPQNSGPDRLKSGYEARLGACWRLLRGTLSHDAVNRSAHICYAGVRGTAPSGWRGWVRMAPGWSG
jgi:hypothetical protein